MKWLLVVIPSALFVAFWLTMLPGPEPKPNSACENSHDGEYIVAVCIDDQAQEVIRGGCELERFMREIISNLRIALEEE